MASFLHARANQGKWLLRIDDIDTPRNVEGAVGSIIETLQIFGLHWDDSITYQSHQLAIYQEVISDLIKRDLAYPCCCTRKQLALNNTTTYPGTCRYKQVAKESPYALRIKSKAIEILFNDELQGQQRHHLSQQYGDFIINRKDHIIAYQLAVVIDDQLQNISHVIRGLDLLDSTPRQHYLQQILGYSTPHYCHVPIIIDQQGNKLSKQTCAQAISTEHPEKTLFFLLELLKQNPPVQLKNCSVDEQINWAIEHWQTKPLKNIRAIKE